MTVSRRWPETVSSHACAADLHYRGRVLEAVWRQLPHGITTDDDFAWQVTEESHVGSWLWEHHDGETWSNTWVYASPWWEGADELVAVSLCTDDHDDGLLSLDLPIPRPSGDVRLDAARYVEVMRRFLANVRP